MKVWYYVYTLFVHFEGIVGINLNDCLSRYEKNLAKQYYIQKHFQYLYVFFILECAFHYAISKAIVRHHTCAVKSFNIWTSQISMVTSVVGYAVCKLTCEIFRHNDVCTYSWFFFCYHVGSLEYLIIKVSPDLQQTCPFFEIEAGSIALALACTPRPVCSLIVSEDRLLLSSTPTTRQAGSTKSVWS